MKLDYNEFADLSCFIRPDALRLIPKSLLNLPCGVKEIAVEIDVFLREEKIVSVYEGEKNINVYNTLYGFAKTNDKLDEVFNGLGLKENRDRRIRLRDSEDRYLLIFDSRRGRAKDDFVVSVSKEEVEHLLDNCLKPNELE